MCETNTDKLILAELSLFKIKYTFVLYLKVDLYATFGPISCDLIRPVQINCTPPICQHNLFVFLIIWKKKEENKARLVNYKNISVIKPNLSEQSFSFITLGQIITECKNWLLRPVSTKMK